jgi:hypothetical protein
MSESRYRRKPFGSPEHPPSLLRAEKRAAEFWASLDAHEAGRRPYAAVEAAFHNVVETAPLRRLSLRSPERLRLARKSVFYNP